jgi:hypothetical protein
MTYKTDAGARGKRVTNHPNQKHRIEMHERKEEKCPFFGHFSDVLAPQVRLELTTLRLTGVKIVIRNNADR